MKKRMIFIASICFLVDQLSKLLLEKFYDLGQSTSIIPSFFHITYVRNEGAAWSLFAGDQFFLIAVSVFALLFFYYYFIKEKQINIFECFSYGVLFGGILGNLIDRIFKGYVVDFLDFTIFNYHFPVFNIADTCIVMGVLSVIILLWKGNELDGENRSNK